MTFPTMKVAEFHRRVDAGERPTATLELTAKMAPPSGGQDPQVVPFVLSDASTDSYNDQIDPHGVDYDKSGAGTVVLFGHDPSKVENIIGRAHNVRTQGSRLVGDIHFAPKEVNPAADVVRLLVLGGYLNSCSIGFTPIEWRPANDPARPGGINFSKIKLCEVSIVPLPANSNALTLARAAGIDVDRVAERLFTAPRSAPVNVGRTVAERRKAAVAVKAANDNGGYRNLAETALAILREHKTGDFDPRLVRAPAGANVGDPSAGGFLLDSDITDGLIGSVYDNSVIAPFCDNRTTDHPLRETRMPGISDESRADGSRNGQVQVYWSQEAAAITATYPKFKMVGFQPRKLFGRARVTRELLNDVSMMDSYLKVAFSEEIAWQLDKAILLGTGAGLPLGVLNSSATIVVPKEAGQASGALVLENIQKMWKRLPTSSRRRAIWLCHEDAEEQLSLISSIAPNAATAYAAAGIGGNPWPTLFGRPLIPVEQASPIGSVGDLVVGDFSRYVTVSAPASFVMSLDAAFDTDEAAFRVTYPVDGKPLQTAPIAPYSGSLTRSPFVTLAAR